LKHVHAFLGLSLLLFLVSAAPSARHIPISPVIPADVPGGAPHADLATDARFAWGEFIALNWPATGVRRDEADPQRPFGSAGGPVVWETFRTNGEIYPPGGSATNKPHGFAPADPSYGYDAPPEYRYAVNAERPDGLVPPCDAKSSNDTPAAWVNLDATTQLGYAHLYTGLLGDKAGSDTVFRYTSKANRTMYRYVASKQFWYGWSMPISTAPPASDTPLYVAAYNFAVAVKDGFPKDGEYRTNRVDFPNGTIEIKAGFRRLTDKEKASGRWYQTRVRWYEPAGKTQCWREDVWGLAALHIMQKTETAPAFTYATFEQADVMGPGIEDEDGVPLTNGPPSTPAIFYKDGVYVAGCKDQKVPCLPIVTLGEGRCTPKKNLFYVQLGDSDKATRMPVGATTCYDRRLRKIPKAIIGVNAEAHRAIEEYERESGVRSPWRHYKLVSVQVTPFDLSEIGEYESKRGPATYYASNVIAESNYTTESFTGGFPSKTGDAPSQLASNSSFLPEYGSPKQFQNAFLLKPNGDLQKRAMMGGCMGCHGIGQVSGGDWSFIILGSATSDPDAYVPDPPPGKPARRFPDMFLRQGAGR